jgi:hypothetical protein
MSQNQYPVSKFATSVKYSQHRWKKTQGGIMKLIVAGSRKVTDYNVVRNAIDGLISQGIVITTLIEGAARGVDSLASCYAFEHGIENVRVPAEWKLYHKGAGTVRNKKMAEMGDALLAIWDGNSSGTKNMITCAKNKGLPVYIHYYCGQD